MSERQVVVITGASAGVGRATAIAFAKRGARIGLIARGRAGLEGARRDVEAAGGEALILQADVADAAQVEAAAQAVEEHFGPLEVWVNNAMASVFAPIKEMLPEDFRRVTEVTYLGYVYGTLAALKRMSARDRGVIVQVGSALAYRSIPLQSAYCAAKHAIAGFTDSLRCELLHDGSHVRVTMVQLPALNTPQFAWVKSRLPHPSQPVPPIFQPEVAAEAILWAADHERREVYVGMSTMAAVFGQKLAPGLLDRYLGRTGYRSQQMPLPRESSPEATPCNLWEAVDAERDYGAHGRFDTRSSPYSIQFWGTRHRGALALAALGAGGLAAAWIRRRR
jgi:NAD(P)-dependent dehydrogenase (short-subunit alcohol dehydrogenase family)